MLLTTALGSWLNPLLAYLIQQQQPLQSSQLEAHTLRFELRHVHVETPSSRVLFADVPTPHVISIDDDDEHSYTVRMRNVRSYRPPPSYIWSERRRQGQSEVLRWEEDEVLGPDIESRATILQLAKMSNNAYVPPNDTSWYDLENWHPRYPVGWEPDNDGFRGHVFATRDNSTVVLSIKGTSAGYFGGTGPTGKKDKVNDNLLFSCCCAHVDWTWTEVCGCYRGGWKCDLTCTEQALVASDDLFYPVGMNLYNNLTHMYPDAVIWVIGHSLGGSLASLIGLTFGAPVVTFESPGEAMAARRLHLPSPPSTQHITHIYHTADPVPMGTCNGVLSACALGGYAMESRCHLGQSIIYDTVSNLSWSVDLRTHGIVVVIEKILNDTWAASEAVGREVPEPVVEEDCVECYRWEYGDFPK